MQTKFDWHLYDVKSLAHHHGVDVAQGLQEAEANRRALQYGPNVIRAGMRRSPLTLLAEQFSDFMVLALIAAAVVSGLIGDVIDTLVILAIILLNALIGFIQSWRADRVLAALKRLAAVHATVLRDGETRVVSATELVPGDIVLLEAGNQIPADLRLVQIAQLKVDESALTGESVTAEKHTSPLTTAASALGDQLNMAFKGTLATHGRGCGIVVATGMATELGKLAGFLDNEADRKTPLQRRLTLLGKYLAVSVVAICAVIFLVGILRGEPPLLMMLTALSLAVAAIPEALPAVVTVLLALGVRNMVAKHVLVRRLPAVETLGSVTVICSDKTGTLTENRMRAEQLWVEGKSWTLTEQPAGNRSTISPPAGSALYEMLMAAALCNDANRPNNSALETAWRGDPTETALAQVACDAGLDKVALTSVYKRVGELPFDSQRKCMTTVYRIENDVVVYTKGAPESVILRCTAQWGAEGNKPLQQEALLEVAHALATQGLRVLAFARKNLEDASAVLDEESLENNLQFLGLIGLIDPPRHEAIDAVRDCISAGITPVMITGDHPATALAIAKRLGIVDEHHQGVISGAALATLNDEQLRERVATVRVYARVNPIQKIRIVKALQARGECVAMTGDGVNDAPALKQADVGVAMGKGGTDAAREAASLVLLDDNFASIVAAVREGRRIYDNIRKFIRYALTTNSSEVWIIFLAPFLALPVPLLPIHILWINLVTDGLPGLALAAEPAERGIMRRPPRPPQENLWAGLWQHVLGMGLLIATLCLSIQAWALNQGHGHWQTMVFTALMFSQMAYVFSIRSERDSLFQVGLFSNPSLLGAVLVTIILQMLVVYVPFLNPVFKTTALSPAEFVLCVCAGMAVFVIVEGRKAWLSSHAVS